MIKLSLYLASVLVQSNFSATTVPAVPQAAYIGASQLAAEQQFMDLVNSERRQMGLGELNANRLLSEVARQHSREMYELGYFDHISPVDELRTPMKRYLKALGYTPSWARLGENLCYCSIVDVNRGHQSLMASAPHRANMLDERYEQMGIGAYISPDGRLYVTQLFLAQRG